MDHFWKMGYSAEDIIGNVFKVCKNHTMDEKLKLKFVKVNWHALALIHVNVLLSCTFKIFLIFAGNWNDTYGSGRRY